jgi:hypothetical protein
MATRSGADTLLRERRELMFPTLTTEQVARIGKTMDAEAPSFVRIATLESLREHLPWAIEPPLRCVAPERPTACRNM